MSKLKGTIAKFTDFNKEFTFFIQNELDLIQRHHLKGELYENDELKIIKSHSNDSRIFFDIGTNVGNHSVFFSKVLNAQRIVCFEANPLTAQILKINILLNDMSRVVNSSYLGMGLGDSFGNFQISYPQDNNIGAARLVELIEPALREELSIIVPVVPMDALNISEIPDFIKIDVEGMELSVLSGMKLIINSFRPKLFIEVENKNLEKFHSWVTLNKYDVVDEFKRYQSNQNFMLIPK